MCHCVAGTCIKNNTHEFATPFWDRHTFGKNKVCSVLQKKSVKSVLKSVDKLIMFTFS